MYIQCQHNTVNGILKSASSDGDVMNNYQNRIKELAQPPLPFLFSFIQIIFRDGFYTGSL